MNPLGRFTSSTRAVLEAAGWFQGRDVTERVEEWKRRLASSGFGMSEAAERALREFGGLSVRQAGPGMEKAREDFEFDPLVADGQEDQFAAHSRLAGTQLFPLGEEAGGHSFLAIGDDGRVFVVGAVVDDLWLLGATIEEALESLVQGKQSPLIARDVQQSLEKSEASRRPPRS